MATVEQLVRSLRSQIAQSTVPHLPSVRQLARSYRCDIHTVSRALRALRDEGVLRFRRGQRITIAGAETNDSGRQIPKAWVSAPERLASEVEQKIITGELRAGDYIPKVEYFVRTWAVSTSTVRQALQRLADQGLIHRRGRTWVVGRETQTLRTVSFERLPIILLIQPSRVSWEGMLGRMAGRFVLTFKTEVERRNIRLLACSSSRFAPGPPLPFEDIDLALNRFGVEPMYTGALVLGRPEDYPDFGRLLERVAELGKPFVWLDRKDEGAGLGIREHMYRCTFSEAAFTCEAIEFLRSMGHGCAGYIGARDNFWQEARGNVLFESGPARGVELLRYNDVLECFKAMDTLSLASHLRALASHSVPMTSKTLSYLLRSLRPGSGGDDGITTLARILKSFPELADGSMVAGKRSAGLARSLPSEVNPTAFAHIQNLLPFLLTPRITAIICPRDRATPNMLGKLTEMGLRVPDDVSLITYDNHPALAFLPVTTVDNGADDLGYQAFHAIVGDVPLRADRHRLIVARPSVVRRGSVKRIA